MEKTVDCLALKDQVQEAMRRDQEGMSGEEIRARMRAQLEQSSSIIARKWRSVRATKRGAAAGNP